MIKNDSQFQNSLKQVRGISMTPREKGEVFHRLHQYTEAHQPVPNVTLYAAFMKMLRGVFAPATKKQKV